MLAGTWPTAGGSWFWDRARATRAIVREARQNALIRSLWWLELKDCNENRHERWLGHGRRLEGLGFGIARAQLA